MNIHSILIQLLSVHSTWHQGKKASRGFEYPEYGEYVADNFAFLSKRTSRWRGWSLGYTQFQKPTKHVLYLHLTT